MNRLNMCRGGLLPLLLAAAAGCSDMNSAEDTFETVYGPLQTAGSGGSGGGQAGNAGAGGTSPAMPIELPDEWACLETPTDRIPINPPPARITYRVAIVDLESQPPPQPPIAVEGLVIKVCLDVGCGDIAGAEDVTITNPTPAPYVYDFSMPYMLSNASIWLAAPGYADMYYILGGPMIGTPSGSPVVGGQTIGMLKTTFRDELYRGIGIPAPAPVDRGDLAIRTLNCNRDPMTGQTTTSTRAAGVTLEAIPENPPEGSVPYFLTYGNLAFPNGATDERGVAGFASLRPQNYRVRGLAPVGEDGMPFGEAIVPVRGGAVTLFEIREGQRVWGQ